MQLHTTVLRVADLPRSREFYERKLEMQVVYEDAHYRLISLVKGDDSRLTLWELRDHERPTRTGKESAYMVFFSQDALRHHEELLSRGVKVGPIEEYPQGLRLFWFSDPDANQFCVIQFLPE
jgi:catechol 2,3-dioxygenase-like lactoylglutathione lyase family enzyme